MRGDTACATRILGRGSLVVVESLGHLTDCGGAVDSRHAVRAKRSWKEDGVPRRRFLALAGVALVGAFVLAGCHVLTGGGWIPSAVGGKAHFAFTAHCENTSEGDAAFYQKGQLQYSDRAAGVRLHSEAITWTLLAGATDCRTRHDEDELEGGFLFAGTYRPQPKGDPGTFLVEITDQGEPGRGGDTFEIELNGGEYDGYTNSGLLEAGNITIHR